MSVGWRLIREHPLVGVGCGNHRPAAMATSAETGINDFLANDAHNLRVWGLGLCEGSEVLVAEGAPTTGG